MHGLCTSFVPEVAVGQFKRARLMFQGPGKNPVLDFSPVDENIHSRGATPLNGDGFWDQLKRGPLDYLMFLSCIGFVLPAVIHLFKHEHISDYLACIALICVSISSPLCDAVCVHGAIYDDGCSEPKYRKAAIATGQDPAEIKRLIEEHQALEEILSPDAWNNFTRGVDRAVCALLVAPAMAYYVLLQRPRIADTLVLLAGFLLAAAFAVPGQHFRKKHPCGIRRGGPGEPAVVTERSYAIYSYLHELWHLILIVVMTASALYRPKL